jgi:predicted PurR-regulated permease PerM
MGTTAGSLSLKIPRRVSFAVLIGVLVLVGPLHLPLLLLTILFGSLTLRRLHVRRPWGGTVAVIAFVILVVALLAASGRFVQQAVRAVPDIADKAIPSVIEWARGYHIELPFTDYDSLKASAMDMVKGEAKYLEGVARFAQGALKGLVLLLAGCVIAIGIFLHPAFELDEPSQKAGNLYSACCGEIARRFSTFYASFETVMGAQIVISAINTCITALFVFIAGVPHAGVLVGLTFVCGLLPVVGNLISNSIIVALAFTVSPRTALFALAFLIVVHKLEYILNGKIIGHRIRNPLWLTLLALIIGERLLGIAGMILAPVVLSYIKAEAAIATIATSGKQE